MKHSKHSKLTLALILLSTSVACSGVEQSAGEDGALSEGYADLDQVEIDQLTEALNNDPACGEATPNKTYSSIISPTFTSPNTYSAGNNGCSRAYFVRVNNYRSGNTNTSHWFEYAGPTPANQAACEDTRILLYAFEIKSDGSAVFKDSRSSYGSPRFNPFTFQYESCGFPVAWPEGRCWDQADPNAFNLTTGKNYVFAVSARTNNAGTPVMQKIKMSAPNYATCLPH